jgi:hypothetical protein
VGRMVLEEDQAEEEHWGRERSSSLWQEFHDAR